MTELTTVERAELVDAITDALGRQQAAAATQTELRIEAGPVKVGYAHAKRGHEPLSNDTIVAISFIVGAVSFGMFALTRIG